MLDIEHTNISDTFGWTASSVWKEFADEKSGTFCKGNLLKEQSITLPYNSNTIAFSAIRRSNDERGMNTQIKVCYQPKSDFVLKIRKRNTIYTPVIFLNRLQNMNMNNPVLKKWIIRTNDKTQCSRIFTNKNVTDLFSALDLFCLETRKEVRSGRWLLYIEINGIVDNHRDMESCLNLVTSLLVSI